MNSSDTRISSYLDDLVRMLGDLDPGERDEVLAGVREHLEATLAEHPDDPSAVDTALLRLGPPERVAAEARAGHHADHPDAAATAATPHSRWWTPAAVVLTLLTTVPFLVNILVVQASVLSAEVLGTPYDSTFGMSMATGVFMPFVSPVWVGALVAALLAPDLTASTRGWLLALGPVSLIVVLLAAFWASPPVVSGVVNVALLLATLGALVVTSVRAWRESRR